MKRITLAQLKAKAKKGGKVSYTMLPSNVALNSGWAFQEKRELTYEKEKFRIYNTKKEVSDSLENDLNFFDHYREISARELTIHFYLV